MKGLLLVVLSCAIELALTKTEIYPIQKECDTNILRSSPSALAYYGWYSSKNDEACELPFKLTDSQKDFTFRIEYLATQSRGVSLTIKQYRSGESPHNAKRIWHSDLRNASGLSVRLNSTGYYVQQVFIEFVDRNQYHSQSVSLQLVVTPSYSSAMCNSHSNNQYYQCHSTQECVHGQLLCDGYNNCDSKEDEKSCHGSSAVPNYGSTTKYNQSFRTTPKPYVSSAHGHASTNFPLLNETFSTSTNGTVVYVLWWWHSWYLTSMIVIGGILLVSLLLGLTVCCLQACTKSCKKNKVTMAASSSSVNSTYRNTRNTPVPEAMQVSVIQSKAYSELPPTYSSVVQQPPEYSQVTVFLESPCGNSNAY